MKTLMKSIVVVFLVAILATLLLIPMNTQAVDISSPGIYTQGKYGISCLCPFNVIITCGCLYIKPPVQ